MITFDNIVTQSLRVTNLRRELSRYESSLYVVSKDGYIKSVRKNAAQDEIIKSINNMIEIESQLLSEMATKFRIKEHYLNAVQACTDNLRLALDANSKEYIEKIEEHFLILENKEDLKYELVFPSL
jgi:hypothetical protein